MIVMKCGIEEGGGNGVHTTPGSVNGFILLSTHTSLRSAVVREVFSSFTTDTALLTMQLAINTSTEFQHQNVRHPFGMIF